MPSTYSQNLRVELIANGEQSGTWGNTTNVNLGTILDSAIAGYTDVTVGSATSLALTANNGAADQSRNMIVQLNSATGGDFNLFIPPASKFYVIRNNTVSSVTIGNSTALNGTVASGGTTVTIKTGVTSLIFSDGTNVREALSGFAGNLIIDGDLIVNGDTTLGNARVSGAYSAPTGSTLSVNTSPTEHGYVTGDYVWLIVKTGDAKSGYYGPITVGSTTTFTFSYASATGLSGNCAVTNDSTTLNAVIRLNGGNDGVIIEGSSTLPALRITQTGGGAALLIDDEANPDSTPFLVDTSGNVVVGNTTALTTFNNSTTTPGIQNIGLTPNTSALGMALFSTTDADSSTIDLAKSAAAAVGTYTAVAADEALGLIRFSGADGTNLQPAATIGGFADAEFTTSGDTTDSPGRLVFSTVPDGSNTLTERMRINNAGNVIIGSGEAGATPSGGTLRAPNSGTGTGFTDEVGTSLTIAAGNGTGTGGSGSILFRTAPVSTTGDTANTLATVMAIANTGNVGIGSTSLANYSLRISKNIANAAGGSAYGIAQDGTIQSNITGAYYNNTAAATEAASFTLTNLSHYRASQGTFGAGSTVTAQYGFVADASVVGATDNYGFYAENTAAVVATKTAYGFYSAVNTATGGGTTYGFYAAGTAANYFSNLLIGDDTALTTRNSTGTATITPPQQIIGTSEDTSALGIFNYATGTASDPSIAFSKSLNATVGSFSQTTNGTQLGGISFNGVGLSTDTAFATAAYIRATVNSATLATGSVPGQLVFGTTNVGGTEPTDRMTLDNRGVLSVGIATASGAALTTTAPAKLFVGDAAYTDNATAASGTVTHGTIVSIDNAPIAATNTGVTYTSASTLYIAGAPTASTNVTIDYPYALFIDSGNMRLDGYLTQVGSTATATVVPLTIEGLTTATPADGITTALNFRTQTGTTTVETGAAIRAIATDVSAGTEDFDLSFVTMAAGATAAERFRAKSTGEFQFNSGYGSVATAYGTRAWVNFNPSVYTTVNATYTWSGTTCTVTEPGHGFLAGDIVYLNFTSGAANSSAYRLFYKVVSAATNTFTISGASLTQSTAANVSYYLCTPSADGNVRRISVGTPSGPIGDVNGYAIMFDTAMPNANYAWTASVGQDDQTQANWIAGPYSQPKSLWKTATALYVEAYYAYNARATLTPADVSIVITR